MLPAMVEPVSDAIREPVSQPGGDAAPTRVVERFLELLRRGDIDGSGALIAAATLRGLLGTTVPAARAKLPSTP
jgi:hypothetical protein